MLHLHRFPHSRPGISLNLALASSGAEVTECGQTLIFSWVSVLHAYSSKSLRGFLMMRRKPVQGDEKGEDEGEDKQ
jgi:hypothetical protein